MAIALDTTTKSSATSGSSLTFSHTCTGSNLILFVGSTSVSVDNVTGITYNGVALTLIGSATRASTFVKLWYLIAPSTGANNIVISRSSSTGNIHGFGGSYTGAKQSAQPDAFNTFSDAQQSLDVSVTTVANNTWIITVGFNQNPDVFSSGTNFTLRQETGTGNNVDSVFGDTNAAISPAGATNVNVTWTGGSGGGGLVAASIAPVPLANTGNFFMFMN